MLRYKEPNYCGLFVLPCLAFYCLNVNDVGVDVNIDVDVNVDVYLNKSQSKHRKRLNNSR